MKDNIALLQENHLIQHTFDIPDEMGGDDDGGGNDTLPPINQTPDILLGNPDATDEQMIHACKLACAHDFVSAFPDGYDTHIEQGGKNVSGGQKQRLCIARALLKKPKILILDDSTSAVDTATDAAIRKAFREEIPGTTKLIIAQRVSSVQEADMIVILDNGMVCDVGTHAELLARCPIYQEVYYSQEKGREE